MIAKEGIPPSQKNRRVMALNPAGNPLLWCKWVGYLFLAMAFYFAEAAKPPSNSFFHHLMNKSASKLWNLDLLTLCWFFLWLTLLVSVGGMILNATQLKRKNDHLSVALIVLLILTMSGMAFVPAGNTISTFISHVKSF